MAVLRGHIPYYKEILALPGFCSEPVLLFGFQDVRIGRLNRRPPSELSKVERIRAAWSTLRHRVRVLLRRVHPDVALPDEYRAPDLAAILRNHGVRDVEILDHFDSRATLRHDMNLPVPDALEERFGTLIDIGCLEHLFDTKTCMENCMRMVKTGGHYCLHTCVNGYLGHGLHTFNPEALVGALEQNGFEVIYCRYSSDGGAPIDDPAKSANALIWLVAKKLRGLKSFESPAQGLWREKYAPTC